MTRTKRFFKWWVTYRYSPLELLLYSFLAALIGHTFELLLN